MNTVILAQVVTTKVQQPETNSKSVMTSRIFRYGFDITQRSC